MVQREKNLYETLLTITEDEYDSGNEDESSNEDGSEDSEEEKVNAEELADEWMKSIDRVHKESGGKIAKEEAMRMIAKAMGMKE